MVLAGNITCLKVILLLRPTRSSTIRIRTNESHCLAREFHPSLIICFAPGIKKFRHFTHTHIGGGGGPTVRVGGSWITGAAPAPFSPSLISSSSSSPPTIEQKKRPPPSLLSSSAGISAAQLGSADRPADRRQGERVTWMMPPP